MTDRMTAVGAGGRKELGFPELVGILYGRRWLLLAGLLLGGIAGGATALSIPPSFTAQALLLLEAQQTRAVPNSAPPALDGGVVDSQPQILASRALARDVIQRLGLDRDPELTGSGGVLERLLDRLAGAGQSAETASDGGDLVGRFLERLTVRRDGKSYVIAVAYRSGEAAKAAHVANMVAELYQAHQLTRKLEQGSRARSLLAEQSELARAQLARSEARLQEFRTRTGHDREEGIGVDGGELAQLNNQLVLAGADRSAHEARLEHLRGSLAGGRAGTAEGASVLLQNLNALKAELLRREAELSGQYGTRHPRLIDLRKEKAELQARIAEEQQAQLRAMAHEVEAARVKEQALATSLEALKGRALRHDEAARGEAALVREVELDRRLYESLVQRASAEADQTTPAADARVISEAVPPNSPTFPKPRLLAALGGTVGLALALFLVYLLESSDRGFAGPDEVQEGLALPTLALVPELPASASGPAPQDYPLEKPRSRYAEALRDILAALQLDPHAGGPGQVVLLTSVLPDEGKSTLALSLGRLAVAEGLRVLVIDADLRRPSIHALAGLKPGPGLIELLRGEVPPEEVIHTDPRSSGLHILASSGRLSQPTRFLTPDRLGRVFQVVRTRFDLVIVDAAPLAAVADPRLLAPLADKTLLLIRHASTRRELCLPMLASLRATGATIAGVVLSRTDLRRYQDTTRYRLGAAQAALARYYAD